MIIEIALGIVLAVVILAYLPELLGLGVILTGLALLVAMGGLLLYWIGSDSNTFFMVLVLGIATALLVSLIKRPSKEVAEIISKRQVLGYNTTGLEASLGRKISEGTRIKKHKNSQDRRELGYTDTPDET